MAAISERDFRKNLARIVSSFYSPREHATVWVGAILVEPPLLQSQAARNLISLVTNASKLFARSRKAKDIDRVIVGLQVVRTTSHWLPGLGKFVRDGEAGQSP